MVHYSLNNIKLAVNAYNCRMYTIAIHTLLTYSVALAMKTTCLALDSQITGLGFENAGLEPIPDVDK